MLNILQNLRTGITYFLFTKYNKFPFLNLGGWVDWTWVTHYKSL